MITLLFGVSIGVVVGGVGVMLSRHVQHLLVARATRREQEIQQLRAKAYEEGKIDGAAEYRAKSNKYYPVQIKVGDKTIGWVTQNYEWVATAFAASLKVAGDELQQWREKHT